MISRTRHGLIMVFLALVTAGASLADDEPDYAEPGYYIVVQGGAAFFRNDVAVTFLNADGSDLAIPVGFEAEVGTDPSFGARLGHRWKNFAVELDFDYVGGFGKRETEIKRVEGFEPIPPPDGPTFRETYSNTGSTVNIFNTTLNARWYPLTWRVQPYLLGGLGFSYVRPKQIDSVGATQFGGMVFGMRVGTGVEVYLTEHIFTDLSATYYYVTGPANKVGKLPEDPKSALRSSDQSFLSVRLGLGYRFF